MHINSQLPPVTSRADLEELMRFGTVFFNAASKHWRSLARICQEASAAFAFPANINLYTTSPGRAVSTPPHADHHDVLIMQSQGSKRWRVFAPPHSRPGRHPLYRGKGEDSLCEAELGPALIDVILRPGECLFVPSGFPHATSTAIAERAAASVHLTLGLAAADCGLTYQTSLAEIRDLMLYCGVASFDIVLCAATFGFPVGKQVGRASASGDGLRAARG